MLERVLYSFFIWSCKSTSNVAFIFQATDLIVKYDEHNLAQSFKFGVIYQKFGQVKFRDIFILYDCFKTWSNWKFWKGQNGDQLEPKLWKVLGENS